MTVRPFQAVVGGTIAIANAASASAPANLPAYADTVALFNTSDTAVVFFRCQNLFAATDSGSNAAVPVPGTPGDIPIPPLMLVRLSVGAGNKKFSVISSAADGTLYITPGVGN